MAKINVSQLPFDNSFFHLGDYLSSLDADIYGELYLLDMSGGLLYSGPDSKGNIDLNIYIQGSTDECFHRKLNPQKKAGILAIRNSVLSRYLSTQKKSGAYKLVLADYLGLLKAFSNNVITMNCPHPIGPIQVRVE